MASLSLPAQDAPHATAKHRAMYVAYMEICIAGVQACVPHMLKQRVPRNESLFGKAIQISILVTDITLCIAVGKCLLCLVSEGSCGYCG